MTASCWGQRYFSCRVLNSSSWANNQSNRGRLTGECVQSLLYEYLFGGRENSDPQRHRGAEGYKPFPSWEDSQVVRRLQRAGKAYPWSWESKSLVNKCLLTSGPLGRDPSSELLACDGGRWKVFFWVCYFLAIQQLEINILQGIFLDWQKLLFLHSGATTL